MKKLISLILLLCLLVPMVPSFALAPTDTGTITVTKQTTTSSGNVAIEGVTYTITQTHTIDSNGNVVTGGSYTATATTDANGVATFSDVPVGRYSVVETAVPEGVILNNTVYTVDLPDPLDAPAPYTAELAAKPSVSFTATKTQGTDGSYEVYPVDSPMLIMKNTPFQYRLGTVVPSDIETAEKYTSIVFTDTLDASLALHNNGEFVVTNGTTTLTLDTDYTVAIDGNNITVTINPTGISKLTANTDLHVVFSVVIPETANPEAAFPNSSTVTYNYDHADGTPGGSTANTSEETYTALPNNSITVNKVDSLDNNLFLAGATFELYRVDTVGATTGGTLVGTMTTPDGTVTGETLGVITYPNLSPGHYYLVETVAPTGYNAILEPIPVEVTDGTPASVTVQNVKEIVMPGTGGLGPILYSILGVVAVIVAFYVILGAKKKKEEAK